MPLFVKYKLFLPLLANTVILAGLESTEFLIIGDWGTPSQNQINVAESMKQHNPDIVLSLGDNFYSVSNGDDQDYDGVVDINDPRFSTLWEASYQPKVDWWLVLGNKDWLGNPFAEIAYTTRHRHWVLPNYNFVKTLKDAVFIILDTNLLFYGYKGQNEIMKANFEKKVWIEGSGALEKQLYVFKELLSLHQNAKWLFVLGHHPATPDVCQSSEDMIKAKELMDSFQVSAYIHGHKHAMSFYREGGIATSNVAHIQQGAGSINDVACREFDDESEGWSIGGIFGFSKLTIHDQSAVVEYYDEFNSKLSSFSLSPRV